MRLPVLCLPVLFIGMLTTGLPVANANPLTLDMTRSQVVFVSRQMNVPVEGRFQRFSAQIQFDAKKPEAARATLEIDTASIDAGSPEASAEVIRKPWLHTAQFPKAIFVSSAVKSLGGERYEVSGHFTLKGKTLPLAAPFTVKSQGGSLIFDGALTLKRLDFGVGDGPWNDPDTVANEVQIRFRFVAK
jgi:polyisoprenoid-binding protein YceI